LHDSFRRRADNVLGLELDKQEDRFLDEFSKLMERGNYEVLTEVCGQKGGWGGKQGQGQGLEGAEGRACMFAGTVTACRGNIVRLSTRVAFGGFLLVFCGFLC
jgi:hypothetical protein